MLWDTGIRFEYNNHDESWSMSQPIYKVIVSQSDIYYVSDEMLCIKTKAVYIYVIVIICLIHPSV